MNRHDFTRELQASQPSPLWGVTPFHIVAIHRWKHAHTTYSNFIKDTEIVESRQPTNMQISLSNHSLPLSPLNQFQHSVLVACNLGDLHIHKNKCLTVPDTFYVEFKQGWKNHEYMKHLLNLFQGYQSSKELVLKAKGQRNDGSEIPEAYSLRTATGYIWEWYHEQVYILEVTQCNKVGDGSLPGHWIWTPKKNLKKTIPTNLKVYFADADIDVVLAYLYMDDGSYNDRNENSLDTTVFCLNDYPRSDLLRLSEYLNKHFGWKTKLRKKREKNLTKKWGKKTTLSWELTRCHMSWWSLLSLQEWPQ